MENIFSKIVYNTVVFITWTVTSFLCHQFGKTFLRGWKDSMLDIQDLQTDALSFGMVFPAVMLTGIQTAFCILFVSLDNAVTVSNSGKTIARLCHVLATLATNISMALMASSSTFAIKMTEPVTSAIVQHYQMGSHISLLTVSSIPVIVGGAISFAGNPLDVSGTASVGMVIALVSNIALSFRNVEIKKMNNKDNSVPLSIRKGKQRIMLSVFGIVMGLIICLYLESLNILHKNATTLLLYLCVSGMFHVTYSYVSVALALNRMSVLSHSMANIMKRLLIVLLLYAFGQRIATFWNFLGLLVCTAGLLVYVWDKARNHAGSNNNIGIPWTRIRKIVIPISGIGFIIIIFASLQEVSPSNVLKLYTPGLGLSVAHLQHLNNYHDARTNRSHGLENPNYTQLFPDSHEFPESLQQVNLGFMKLPSHQNVLDVNFFSEKMSTSNEVIKESQRLHFNIIGKEIGAFKYAFLFDLAAFENKGDPAITVGEIYFLARMNIEVKYYCSTWLCSKDRLKKARNLAQKYTSDELVILVQGGGNIIAYEQADLVRFDILELFPSFKIVIFPQSIWIPVRSNSHVKKTAVKFCCNPNLTIVLRDPRSYSIAKRLYNGTTRLIMAPDMAFQIGHVPRFMSPVFDVMWIKRDDRETPGYKLPKHIPGNLKVHVSDWYKWLTPKATTNLEKAVYTATNGFFFLQRGRVVITDRLHGHILSVLSDIPHVLIDNKAKKLSSYHNTWTRSLNNTVITDDPSKALGLAIELLKKYNDTLSPVVPFLHLREDFSKPVIGVPDMTFP